MADFTIDETYVETNSNYNRGCVLSEYNGTISIAGANEGKEGKKYLEWCYPKTKDGAGATMIPNQVRLGDIEQAKTILKQYLDMLNGGSSEGKTNDKVPF